MPPKQMHHLGWKTQILRVSLATPFFPAGKVRKHKFTKCCPKKQKKSCFFCWSNCLAWPDALSGHIYPNKTKKRTLSINIADFHVWFRRLGLKKYPSFICFCVFWYCLTSSCFFFFIAHLLEAIATFFLISFKGREISDIKY